MIVGSERDRDLEAGLDGSSEYFDLGGLFRDDEQLYVCWLVGEGFTMDEESLMMAACLL